MLHTGVGARGLSWHSLRVNGAFGWRVVLVSVVLFSLFSATIQPSRAAIDSYVDTDVLYLRTDPGTDAGVIAEMYDGDYVAVIDGPTEDGWYFLDYEGSQGWAYGAYLNVGGSPGWESAAADASVGGSGPTVWVATDALNIRAEPTRKSWVLGTVGQGESLSIAGEKDNGFYPVWYGDNIGWVAGKYLSWEPVSGGEERWIDVDRSSSTIRLMVGIESVGYWWAAMGFDDSDNGFYSTAVGTYYVYEKNAALTWTDWARGYIEYWVAFDPDRFNGFHSWTMDKNGNVIEGGDGATGGCVAMEPGLAAALYEFATYGMRVEIHW
ncbi:MAG TPA: SH3 domain-containing protein [Thermomicrobiales bacterium]|jgi:lipoprotein-anchoring transpeptidase ErfK/SrfK|nr:SH3 domain-containing protein [Thermomicrobiales bacterium]